MRVRFRSLERLRRRRGFLLADALIAAAIIFAGLGSLANVIPSLSALATKQRVMIDITYLALSKQEDLIGTDYASVATSATGNFSTLFGSNAPSSISSYSWTYTSTEEIPNILKKVSLGISFSSPGVSVSSDTFIFYVVDYENRT